jgi:hypothetical protein
MLLLIPIYLLPPPAPIVVAPPADITDAPSPDVLLAKPQLALVQWGTQVPFTGNGPPGIDLTVNSTANVIGWSMSAWATQVTPPTYEVCHNRTVYFSIADWAFLGGDGRSDSWRFASTPTTTWQRMAPDGDQCLTRIQATGLWAVRLCMEGKPGGPRGLYEEGGRRHIDSWDSCVDRQFRVPS